MRCLQKKGVGVSYKWLLLKNQRESVLLMSGGLQMEFDVGVGALIYIIIRGICDFPRARVST